MRPHLHQCTKPPGRSRHSIWPGGGPTSTTTKRQALAVQATDQTAQQHSPTTADGTPVIIRTNAEWDTLRAQTATRNPDDVARQLAERKAAWSQQRKAYEAAQTKAVEVKKAKTATARVRRFARLAADAARSVITPAALIADQLTPRPVTANDMAVAAAESRHRGKDL